MELLRQRVSGCVHVKASIYMPSLRVLRNIVDRMKNLSNFVRVSANNSGELKLCVETDLVTVSTYFHDLDRPVWRQYNHITCHSCSCCSRQFM